MESSRALCIIRSQISQLARTSSVPKITLLTPYRSPSAMLRVMQWQNLNRSIL